MLFERVDDWRFLIEEACEKCECPSLTNEIKAEFSSMRMTSCLGVAYSSQKLIRLSLPLWPFAEEHERAQVIVHETCHVIDAHLNGRTKSHGESWKALMWEVGYVPHIYHNVNTAKAKLALLRRKLDAGISEPKRHARSERAKCLCVAHPITKNKATRIRKGTPFLEETFAAHEAMIAASLHA